MLCAACEGRFSVFEEEVCRTIFLPIHERKLDRFRYGLAFARFAVSVAWRALVALKREGGLGHLNEICQDVEAAEIAWREFLLEQRSTPAPHVVVKRTPSTCIASDWIWLLVSAMVAPVASHSRNRRALHVDAAQEILQPGQAQITGARRYDQKE